MTLGLSGQVQLKNASLALALSHAFLHPSSYKQTYFPVMASPFQILRADALGLALAKWPGRSQILRRKGILTYGFHAYDHGSWFALGALMNVTKRYFLFRWWRSHTGKHRSLYWVVRTSLTTIRWNRYESSNVKLIEYFPLFFHPFWSLLLLFRTKRVLIFNTTGDRNSHGILLPLRRCHFDVAIFCPNIVSTAESTMKGFFSSYFDFFLFELYPILRKKTTQVTIDYPCLQLENIKTPFWTSKCRLNCYRLPDCCYTVLNFDVMFFTLLF